MNTHSPHHGSRHNRIVGRTLTAVLAITLVVAIPPATAASPPTSTSLASAVTLSAPAKASALPSARTMTSTVHFAAYSAHLTRVSRLALTRVVRALPETAVVAGVQVRGYVQGSPTTRDTNGLARARAVTVAAWLARRHLAGPATLTAGGVAGSTWHARRVDITITYRVPVGQAISFLQPEGMTVGDADQPLTATSTTGGPATLASLTPSVCTVVSGAAHAVSAGTCALRASQAGTAFVLPAAPVTRSFVVTAAPAAQYVVTYDANGGMALDPSAATFTVGGSALTLPTPTRDNSTFDGWYTAPADGTLVGAAGDSYTPVATTTLYAHWSAAVYVVQYDANGGFELDTDSAEFTVGGDPLILPTPVHGGFAFLGWFTAAIGGVLVGSGGAAYSPVGSQHLYAHWDLRNK